MQLTVTVEKVGTNQARAKVLAGAPFAVDIPVTPVDGTLAGERDRAERCGGRGGRHGAHRDPHDRDDGGGDRGRRPDDPTDAAHVNHSGYIFVKAATGLPAAILPAAGASTDATLSGLVVNDGTTRT